MSVHNPEIEDLAPPAWVRAHETFWACELSNFDRDTVLGEVGCGSGQNMLRASSFVGTIIGVESDPALLAQAQRAVTGRPGLSVLQFLPPELPFPAQSLDVLFADFSRPAVSEVSWIKHARSCLRDHGSLLLLTYQESPTAQLVANSWRDRAQQEGFANLSSALRSSEDLRAQLVACGFDVGLESFGETLTLLRATTPDG